MVKTASKNTGRKSSTTKTTVTVGSDKCTLSIKPKILTSSLGLLYAAISSNKQGIDRLKIEVGDGKSVFSVGGDVGVEIAYQASKTLKAETVQVSCKQIKSLASYLDTSEQQLTLGEEKVTVANRKRTYSYELLTYKDVFPEDKAEYEPVAKIKALEFKQALDKVIPFVDNDLKTIFSGVCLQLKSVDPSIDEDVDSDTLGLTLTGITVPSMMSTVTIRVDSVDTNSLSSLFETTIVLPKKAASFIASQVEDFTLLISEKSVRFEWLNVKCSIQTLKGTYQNVDEILEGVAGNNVEVEFNRNELFNALKRHQVTASEVEFSIEGETCRLSQSNEAGSGAENIYCRNDSDESITLNLLIDNLVKVLNSISSETVVFKLDLEPDKGESEPSNNILIQDGDATYCLAQLIASNQPDEEDEEE